MSTVQRKRTYEWADPQQIAEMSKSMSGIDLLSGIMNGTVPEPPFATTLDIHPTHLEKGIVRFELIPQEFHFNPIGSVHGGVITTVLDSVMGCALHSVLEHGFAYTTLELKINFTKAVTLKSGRLIGEGRVIHLGKTTALLEADLKNEAGILYAHGTSTCVLLNLNTNKK